ncbi:exosortase S [Microbacterium sp. SORGH_AS_0888]|uniref:exosortase S n=1 Tax=Microbacterium sp. SORGH_AS_0888 TaxID=3041791 RepID=UPI0027862B41|nr:exosortase S [Microbacterium sp. SORGH_AS_0888]MDQ1131381.1 exosortase/archaeosortase family protein [Microbacterium sp. SORGH_AS_0888]
MTVLAGAPIRRTRVGGVSRLPLSLSLLATAGLLALAQERVRDGEAQLARLLIGLITPGRASAAGPIVYFGIGTGEVTGLSITTMCSTTVLILPLLLIAAVVAGLARTAQPRIIAGLAGALALAVTCNVIRFAGAAWAYAAFGMDGFDLVHRYIGSLFVIAGFIAAIVLFLRVSLREPRSRRAQRRATDAPAPQLAPGALRRDLHAREGRRAHHDKGRRPRR